jgi:hypothetical protein
MKRRTLLAVLGTILLILPVVAFSQGSGRKVAVDDLGRELSIPVHLTDDEEFSLPLQELVAYGKTLFEASWTDQEGAGRPMMKGTGRMLSDPSDPLVGARSFNRLSGPDANSCAGCHNAPYGIAGGGGDFVTNVFVLGQRFDFITFDPREALALTGSVDEKGQATNLQSIANLRATTGLFGSGYLEMLAREMTADLQAIRDTVGQGQSKRLVSKGISFGTISRKVDGLWDVSQVEGISRLSLFTSTSSDPPSLILRPWHQAANVISLREFTNNAFNHHHGIQSTERFGLESDPDGDGFNNEMTRADVTAVTVFQATLPVPGRVIPNRPTVERAVLLGEQIFERIGCGTCHVPALPLGKGGAIYAEPDPFNPAGNLRRGETQALRFDLNDDRLPQPRLHPDPARGNVIFVPAYTDLKLHDITSGPEDPNAESLDMNFGTWSPKFSTGNRKFLTKRLWGCANEPPFFHHGRFTTLRQSILAHSGEALPQRKAFQTLSKAEQDAVIEFLKTLQVLPPGTKDLIVDEHFRKKEWPPIR